MVSLFSAGLTKKLTYNEFYYLVEHNLEDPAIAWVKLNENRIFGGFRPEAGQGERYFQLHIPKEDKEIISLLRKNVSKFEVEAPGILSNLKKLPFQEGKNLFFANYSQILFD